MRYLELNRTDKAKVSGTQGKTTSAIRFQTIVPSWLELCDWHTKRRINRHRLSRRGGLVSAYTQLCAIVLWHLGAIERLRPAKSEAVHHFLTTRTRTFTKRPARWYCPLDNCADRRVDSAQEKPKIRAAFHLDEWYELMHLLTGILLFLMVHQVRHDGFIIRDIHAEIDRNGLATTVMRERITAVQGTGRAQDSSDDHHRPQHLWSSVSTLWG